LKVEVINTGHGAVAGSVVNTHLKYLAEALFPLGLRIERQVTVPDGEAIREALVESFTRADVVLVTGGLGPTTDDITREIVADLYGLELIHDETIMRGIAGAFCAARTDHERSRAAAGPAPRGGHSFAKPTRNRTRSLLSARLSRRAAVAARVFLLPGPPRELKPMFTDSVLPILTSAAPQNAVEMRVFRIAGLGESAVEELVGPQLLSLGLELGYCARLGEVDVRTIGSPGLLQKAEALIQEKLAGHIVSAGGHSLEKVIVDLLAERGETLAVAESCTGGYIAHRITNVPGSSAVFLEGFVTYANAAKSRALSVDAKLIAEHGAVSREVVSAMAQGALQHSGAQYAVATTGIAGPGGGTEQKPVGTVYIALATRGAGTRVERHRFATDRESFKVIASQAALDLLRRHIPPPAAS
jgi:nicotinamide-nucleotide amidase